MKISTRHFLTKVYSNYSYGYEQTSEQCTNYTNQCETSTNGSYICVSIKSE